MAKMTLYEACPRCARGDIVIDHVGGAYLFACLTCRRSGVLRSVYPLVRLRPTLQASGANVPGRDRAPSGGPSRGVASAGGR